MELALSIGLVIKSVTPVDSEKSDDREIYPDADSGRTLDLERIEIADISPAVTSSRNTNAKSWTEAASQSDSATLL